MSRKQEQQAEMVMWYGQSAKTEKIIGKELRRIRI